MGGPKTRISQVTDKSDTQSSGLDCCLKAHTDTMQETFDAAVQENQSEFGMEVNYVKLALLPEADLSPVDLVKNSSPHALAVQPEEALQSALEEFKLQVSLYHTTVLAVK